MTEFQRFAAIGSDYTRAVDIALVQTGHLAIQANSIELIANRQLAPISREALEQQDQTQKAFVTELSLLRRQVFALNDYFGALAALSGSKAPEKLAAGLNTSAGALTSISASLGASGGRLGQAASAGAAVGELYVSKRRMRLLEEELEQRGETIDEILRLQEKLLEVLAGIAEEDQVFVGERSYEANVWQPFQGTAPLAAPTLWMADREAALLAGPLTGRLELAAAATRQLRLVWGKLLSRDIETLDLATLAQSVADAVAGPIAIPAPQPPSLIRWTLPEERKTP